MSRMPAQEDVAVMINKSLFSRVDENGIREETMVDYLCIHEQEQGGVKTRWLFLAAAKNGKFLLHKGKENSNGTFSRGKTWMLDDMRQLEQTGPVSFAITMTSRTYKWRADNARDLGDFLSNIAKSYKTATGTLPRIVNFTPDLTPAPTPPPSSMPPSSMPRNVPASSSASVYSSRFSDASFSTSGFAASTVPNLRNQPQPDEPSQRYTPSQSRAQPGGRSPQVSSSQLRSATTTAPGTAVTPSSSSGHLIPPRTAPGMQSSSKLSSSAGSHQSLDLQPPARPSRTSFSSDGGGRSVGSQDGHDRRPKPPVSRDRDQRDIGLGVPPQRRRGSGDDRSAQGYEVPVSAPGRRRPSAASSTAPSIPPPPPEDDPYGGMDPYGGVEEPELDIPPVPPMPARMSAAAASPSRPEIRVPPVVNEPEPEPQRETSSRKLDRSPTPGSDRSGEQQRGTPNLAINTLAPPEPQPRSRERPPSLAASQRRVSFHPPPLTTAYSRDVLLMTRTGQFGAMEEEDPDEAGDAIMANVEEMIEGFDWTAVTTSGGDRNKGTDVIEGRLLDELAALESANIHAFLESDDRIDQVIAHIDDALMELDDIDMQLAGYRVQLSAVSDDIKYIEGQNRGLQVQTSNQHALLNEIRQLLQITDVPRADLAKLSQISPNTTRGVEELEQAAASLYKAIQASREKANESSATNQHMREYRDAAVQFCTRVLEYLDIAFKHQSASTLADFRKAAKGREVQLGPHTSLGAALMAYEGLVLFVKDMDDDRFRKLCTNYITTISDLHQSEMGDLLRSLKQGLPGPNQATDIAFAKAQMAPPPRLGAIGGAVARAKTVKRTNDSKVGGGGASEKKANHAAVKVAEAYNQAMTEIIGQIVTEDDFIGSFLHLADNESTFADYMQLDTYFRRQATRHASRNNPSLIQIARSVMDLMFGFVDGALKTWVNDALKTDMSTIVGMIAAMEHLSEQAEQEGTSLFLTQLFDKQLSRNRRLFDNFISDQIKTIDGAKTNMKRRRGVFYFVRHFPVFVERLECQLVGADGLKIRQKVDDAYERVVASVLGSLQYLSKIVAVETSSGEDKGQLYFHVVMIENLHVFVEESSHLKVKALQVYTNRARGLYRENMEAYIKMMMRRGFSRIMDFMDGVERLMKTTPPNEVSLNPNYSKSTLKKVLKDTTAKDMRKAVEAMARRVDKHFAHDDDGPVGGVVGGPANVTVDAATQALIAHVWSELSNALKHEITRAIETIAKCYDNTLTLDYTLRDMESACQRAKATR